MPLQVRLKHALGERLMELPDRTAESPLIVGRASSSDLQVPSVSVGPRHCALFRHEGHWVIQDVGGTSGTFVNGQPVSDPVFLQIGDVVSVGAESSAPTIEIDPAAAAEGRQGYAGEAIAEQVVPAGGFGYGAGDYSRPVYPPSYGQPGGYAQPGYGYAAPPQGNGWSPAAPAAAAPASDDGWGDAADTSYTPRTPRRPQKNNTVPILITVGVSLAAFGGLIWLVVSKNNAPTTTEVIVKPPVKIASSGKKDLFDMGDSGTAKSKSGSDSARTPSSTGGAGGRRKPASAGGDSKNTGDNDDNTPATPTPAVAPPAVTPPAVNPPSTPAATPTAKKPAAEEGMDPVDPAGMTAKPGVKPEMSDPAGGTATAKPPASAIPPAGGDPWQEVENLNASQLNPAIAIFRMDDYKRLNPGKHDDDIDKWMNTKFDQIWWERIEQLFKKRDRLTADIQKKQKQMWDENNPEEKKKQMAEKTQMDKDLKRTNETLRTEMSYAGEAPPDTSDKSQLATLTEQRDKNRYELWKKITLKYVRDSKGKLQWDGEQ